MMINCSVHSFRVCPLKYSPVQTGNKISQEANAAKHLTFIKERMEIPNSARFAPLLSEASHNFKLKTELGTMATT